MCLCIYVKVSSCVCVLCDCEFMCLSGYAIVSSCVCEFMCLSVHVFVCLCLYGHVNLQRWRFPELTETCWYWPLLSTCPLWPLYYQHAQILEMDFFIYLLLWLSFLEMILTHERNDTTRQNNLITINNVNLVCDVDFNNGMDANIKQRVAKKMKNVTEKSMSVSMVTHET